LGSEWSTRSLKEVGVQLIDCDHKTPKAQESGFPYIGIPQMKNGHIDFDADPRLITESDLVTWTRKAKPQTHDVLLSRRCNPGETAYVGTRTEFALGQNLVILRASDDRVFPPYLRWVVKSHQWWAEVSKYLNPGAVFDSLKCADIPKFEVPFPPLAEQKTIAHILGTLDDKIELNRRMNATLERMAQALFKSWFVDFDPVIDNALAAGNPIPDELAPRAEIRKKALAEAAAQQGSVDHPTLSDYKSLFPAEFQETESGGWIPMGWEETSFGEHINLQTGPAFKSKDFTESGTRLARGDNVKEGRFQWGDKSRFWTDVDESLEKYLLSSGDVLLGMDGSKVGKNRVRVRDTDLPSLLVQRVARLTRKDSICSNFIFLAVNSERFREYVDVVKTGSAIPHISGGQIKALPLVLPRDKESAVFGEFECLASSLFKRTDALVAEVLHLTKLRDTLLPKLISGDLQPTTSHDS